MSFSKIVATPTLNSWSQAYNAGKLFSVLSIEKINEQNVEIESLNILGKNLLEKLEQEFFTIEIKDLDSIKKAVSNTFDTLPDGITVSFVLGHLNENVLYVFILGKGNVFIKRDGKIGNILTSSEENPKNIVSSSGFVNDNDLIILATDAFSEIITNDDLNATLDDLPPAEIAESFAPKIHKAENGKIAAIFIQYSKPEIPENIEDASQMSIQENPENSAQPEKIFTANVLVSIIKKLIFYFKKYSVAIGAKTRRLNFRNNPRKKLFLIIIVVTITLISSSILAIQKQNNAKIKALFAQIYPEAQKKYELGQSLLDLNKNLAKDSLMSAQKILSDNQDKFPKKSKEAMQTEDLLQKVKSGLDQASGIDKSGLNRGKLLIEIQNGSGVEGTAGKASKIIKEFGYNVTSTGNADNFNYIGVTIKVKKEKSNFLDLLKKDLAKDYTITTTSSDLPSSSPTDSLIIIGK